MGKKTARELLGFNDWPFMLIGIPLSALLLPFVMPGTGLESRWDYYGMRVIISFCFVIT